MAVRYRELLTSVSKMTGLDAGAARAAAEATVAALARALPEDGKRRLLAELPRQLYNDFPLAHEERNWDQAEFVRMVSLLGRRPPEQARLRAQAVLTAIAEQDRELLDGLPIPEGVRALITPPDVGGAAGPGGPPPPLTDEEVAAALHRLPDWSGDRHALRRTVVLPPENLDRVLRRVRAELGTPGRHKPKIIRHDGSAEFVLRTESVGAVTSLDVATAEAVDSIISAAGAGMGSP